MGHATLASKSRPTRLDPDAISGSRATASALSENALVANACVALSACTSSPSTSPVTILSPTVSDGVTVSVTVTATGVGGNVSFYRNPAFDRLMDTARRETDEPRRNALYRQADSLAYADAPMLYLYFYDKLFAVQPWIQGFTLPVIFNGQRWTGVSFRPPTP